MDLMDRLIWLALGGTIGFVLGYIVRSLHEIKEKVEHVDKIVSPESKWEQKNDSGFMRFPIVADLCLLLALFLTVWASFASQHASNQVKETQKQVEAVTHCNQVYLSALLKGVDSRTTSAKEASDANAELQQAWYQFVRFQLHIPPYPEDDQRRKANIYANKLHAFVEAYSKSKVNQNANPYPTDDQLASCISKEKND